MVLARFEPLNPLTPHPDLAIYFVFFWQAIGEFQFLVSVIPASYWRIRAYKVVFADKLLGISHLEGLVVATSYWEIHIRKVSVYLFFESLQHSGS